MTSCLFGLLLTATQPAPDPADWPRERLVALMRELTAEVFERQVVRDPTRAVYGMCYEFWRDGRASQAFLLDAMHDGAWLVSALLSAHRADPEGPYLELARRYLIPFYTNLLNNSDRLFPAMKPTDEDKVRFTAPLKGWCPRGWDDGQGYDKTTGRLFAPGYSTASNHLAQDLADMLANVWLTTRDPAAAEALGHLHAYKSKHFGPIRPLDAAQALVTGDTSLLANITLPAYTPACFGPLWRGAQELQAASLPSYDDDLAWWYTIALGHHRRTGQLPDSFALYGLARVHGLTAAMEAYCDVAPYRWGFFFFDLQRQPGFVPGTGRLSAYQSDGQHLYGARGVQLAWVAAGLLPALRARPELWPGPLPEAPPEGREHRRLLDLPREQALARFEAICLGSIATWAEIRREMGFVPSAYPGERFRVTSWEVADSGNYAHLIRCLALYLLDRQGTSEWAEIARQWPAEPLPAYPLPDSVRRAQGLLQ